MCPKFSALILSGALDFHRRLFGPVSQQKSHGVRLGLRRGNFAGPVCPAH